MANILVIGPHPDDQELGMGGTIARLSAEGHAVVLLDVTNGEPTPFGDPVTRANEAREAAAELSAPGNPVVRLMLGGTGLPNREVVHSIENRHLLAGVIRAHQIDVMFVPHAEDAHPDHLATTRIAVDARFDAKLTKVDMPGDGGRPPLYPRWLFYYYATHLRLVPSPSFIIDTSAFTGHKARAIMAYQSQMKANPKNHGLPARVATGDAYFGSRIGTAAGEPFWTPEPLGLIGLAGVVGV